MSHTPFAVLLNDHQQVRTLLDKLLAKPSPSATTQRQLFEELRAKLQKHEQIEESAVYPELTKKAATKDLALESYEEHHVVDCLLDELAEGDPADASWQAKLSVLQENLLHHLSEEEDHLFPDAEANLAPQRLERIEEGIASLNQELA